MTVGAVELDDGGIGVVEDARGDREAFRMFRQMLDQARGRVDAETHVVVQKENEVLARHGEARVARGAGALVGRQLDDT